MPNTFVSNCSSRTCRLKSSTPQQPPPPFVPSQLTGRPVGLAGFAAQAQRTTFGPQFNQAQPFANAGTIEKTFETAEQGIPMRCDVHPWMNAFVSVFDHPYFSVSSDGGEFTLQGLPPGDYVLEAWHETLGTATQSITVVAGETATLDFDFGG